MGLAASSKEEVAEVISGARMSWAILAQAESCWVECVFRPKSITDSRPSRSLIPRQGDQRFRSKPITVKSRCVV